MNNLEIKLHIYQKELLRKLATTQASMNFNSLLIDGLASEHMNYHLKKLIKFQLVLKQHTGYLLTDKGKDYINLMDDDIHIIEKQPKTSVLIYGIRKNSNGEIERLLSKRLKHPYFGKVGMLTGKVQYGEKIIEAAQRELYEETGLKANITVVESVYHKLRHKKDGVYVQDVLFYQVFMSDFEGQFITKTPYQQNLWLTVKDAKDGEYDLFDDLNLDNRLKPLTLSFVEKDELEQGY